MMPCASSTGVTVITGDGDDTIPALKSRVSLMRILQAGVEGRALSGAELEYAQEPNAVPAARRSACSC